MNSFAEESYVRVRLSQVKTSLKIRGEGISVIDTDRKALKVSIRKSESVKIELVSEGDSSFWIVKKDGYPQQKYFSRFLFVRGKNLFDGRKKLTDLILLDSQKKKINIIAYVPLEIYVAGVVSGEMPWSWPEEALKAQSIAARSYVLSQVGKRKNQLWHVEASVADQVFSPLYEVEHPERYKKVFSAVLATAGQVLVDKNLKVLRAFYHSDCGGKTVDSQSVWGTPEVLVSVEDADCPKNPKSSWSYEISKNELDEIFHFKKIFKREKSLKNMSFTNNKLTGRVDSVELEVTSSKVRISGVKLRELIGFDKIRSTKFRIEKSGQKFVFIGQGYGHGVGLCQWGTKSLAAKGIGYKNILKHYYPQMKIVSQNESLQLPSAHYAQAKE